MNNFKDSVFKPAFKVPVKTQAKTQAKAPAKTPANTPANIPAEINSLKIPVKTPTANAPECQCANSSMCKKNNRKMNLANYQRSLYRACQCPL